jgi:hypothetical protein
MTLECPIWLFIGGCVFGLMGGLIVATLSR